MTTEELRKLSIKELEERKIILTREKIGLYLKKKNRTLNTPHQLKKTRQNIARLNGVLAEK